MLNASLSLKWHVEACTKEAAKSLFQTIKLLLLRFDSEYTHRINKKERTEKFYLLVLLLLKKNYASGLFSIQRGGKQNA
jgi:hypothetical protein